MTEVIQNSRAKVRLSSKINLFIQLFKHQGLKYVLFRVAFIIKKKTGWLKREYPTWSLKIHIPSYNNWLNDKPQFFIENRRDIKLNVDEQSISRGERILAGELPYFSSQWYPHSAEKWVTNPRSGYVYPLKHFSEIPEIVETHGDIKYVWEASRFCWLYEIMKYDMVADKSSEAFVFGQIESWIDHNPLNLGPNYICSQEIALRVLNWTYVLHFYSGNGYMTDQLWKKIMNSIAGQMRHIYKNRRFALIAVRNNHTLTEMLGLYVVGNFFSFLPEASTWAAIGKKHFEQEVAYQIDEDGSYIQQSFNYQRVVVQLLTWAIRLGQIWKDEFSKVTYSRAFSCLKFLQSFCQPGNGYVPNYGANDGALFFPLSNSDYRNYRPQLNALAEVLKKPALDGASDACWFGISEKRQNKLVKRTEGVIKYERGGYYLMQLKEMFGFVRCNTNLHRPSHADNLHLDVWYRGENLLMDGGSYLYNTSSGNRLYFFGSQSHNTVMLDEHDQMLKGPRFVWLSWTRKIKGSIVLSETGYMFDGEIEAFSQLGKHIRHARQVEINGEGIFIKDKIKNKPAESKLRQGWHVNSDWIKKLQFKSTDEKGDLIDPVISEGWVSNYYGIKTRCKRIEFATLTNRINTHISLGD